MAFLLTVLTAPAVLGPAQAAEIEHDVSASSSAVVEVLADGTVKTHARNTTLIPYALFDGELHLARLAAVTTDVIRRTDAEVDDPGSSVSVTVDDLSAGQLKRLASFSDPGSAGAMLGESYFDSVMPGCCAGPNVHSLRTLEDGRLLYRATGDDGSGSSAWAIAPNAGPRMVRWAAFDGRVEEAALKKGVVGYLSYGSLDGMASRLEVRAEPSRNLEDMNLGLSHLAKLVWVDAATQKNGHKPSSGSPADPENIWSLDHVTDAAKIGGFAVRLINYDGRALATIPITADRLDAAKATKAKGITLSETPPASAK